MSKVKSIFKRSLAILLAMLTIMSVGLTSAIALNLEMAQTAGYTELAETGAAATTLYLEPNSNWKKDGARFAAYFFGNGEKWVSMTAVAGESNLYEVAVPSGFAKVIFCRMNGGNSTNDWNNKWNQTGDLTIPTDGKNKFTVPSNDWNGSKTTWSKYAPKHSVNITSDNYYGTTFKVDDNSYNGEYSDSLEEGTKFKLKVGSATNYYVSSLKINGEECADIKDYFPAEWYIVDYEFTVTGDLTIEIEHSPNPTLTLEYDNTMGKVEVEKFNSQPAGNGDKVDYRKKITYTITPFDGYKISNVIVNGSSLGAVSSGEISEVKTDPSIKVVFAPDKWDVKFYSDNVQFGVTQEVNHNGTATPPATNPTKQGYTFKHWSTTVNGATAYNFSTAVTSDLTLYAVWEAITYTVTFQDKDGNTIGAPQTVEWGKSATAPTAPDVPGWSFSKWDKDFSSVKSDLEVKAVYTQDEYTITLGTNGDGGKASASKSTGIKYGDKVTLTANADTTNGYVFAGWSIEGAYECTGELGKDATIELTVKGNIKVTANFELDTFEVNVTYDSLHSSSASASSATAKYGSTVTLTAEPDTLNGVQFAGWDISGEYKIESGNLNSSQITIVVNSDVDATAKFTQLDSFTYTVSASPSEGGTVLPESNIVYDGSSVLFTAVANTGYVFKNWTVVSDETYNVISGNVDLPSIGIIPHAKITVTANFEPVTGTINVTAGAGGTVEFLDGTEDGEVKYPDIVKAKATGDASQGYEFTHWTVESAGKKDTDYKVTEKDNVIEVQILTQGTVVNVTANFANAQKIKVYTYSDNGFKRLTITESNGTETKTPVNNETQSAIVFGNKTWYTPGEVSLTPGFSNSITAQLSTSSDSNSGDIVIYVQLSDSWMSSDYHKNSVGPYMTITSSSNKSASGNLNANNTSSVEYASGTDNKSIYCAENDTIVGYGSLAGNGVYKWIIPSGAVANLKNNGFTIFSKEWHYKDMHRLNISHGTYVTGKDLYVVSENNNNSNQRECYGYNLTVSDKNYPTQTDPIPITNILYDGNTWRGLDEVWLYFTSDGKVLATDRRELSKTLSSADIVKTYNNGSNDVGWDGTLWGNFTDAYEDAVSVLGDPASEQDDIKDALDALNSTRGALSYPTHVTVYGSNGAEPKKSEDQDFRYGTTSFPSLEVDTGEGNIGDYNKDDWYHYKTSYIYATVERDSYVTVNTKVDPTYAADYLVYGWVINGTDWLAATVDTEDPTNYIGTYKCAGNTVFVPIYFRKSTIANWQTDANICKIYANTKGSSSKWGNYISAYTWTNNKTYYQFGHWTGQLMIPIPENPGMYYTFLEFQNPDKNDNIAGIAFTNYGNNTPINSKARYQTYDYYEFKELKTLGKNNIVFQLKTFDEGANWNLNKSKVNLSDYQFDYFRDFSGNLIDINRNKIVEGRAVPDPELYIVRTGPVKASEGEGFRKDLIKGSDYYIDTYVYDKNGNFIVACKSFELLDLKTLFEKSGKDLRIDTYKGVPVMVDYASLTTSGNNGENKRYDGEWFGTVYGFDKVTIKTDVAFQNEDGTIQYCPGQNEVEGVGNAYFNGLHFQEVSHGSENHTISAIVADGNDFVGWYKATVADDGTYTIDATATPLFTERSVSTIDASADAVYVAVFKTHPEGTFTVNNYYYTYDDFKGQPMGEHLPPVFGNDTTYSIRDVKIHKIYDAYSKTDVSLGNKFAGTYTQSMGEISVGDKLEITIRTTPTYTRDYVYAWYIQANEADGKINFEEVGTDAIKGDTTPGKTKEFTFTYTVEAGVDTITIYSDVVHISPKVTFTYIYNNRYNQEQKYIVNYTLTDAELKNFDDLKNNDEFKTKIRSLAPFVGDLYKNVTWKIENISADATNWTLRASEDDVYTVNVNVNGIDMQTPITGKFNDTVSLYAKDVDESVTGQQGIWYLDTDRDKKFTEGEDEILGLGSYYGLVITGDVNVCFTNETEVMNQIILADAVYGYERATDGSGNVTTNKVYVDYLISMLLNVYTGGYIDCNNNNQKDENEPTIIDEENTNAPVSLKAIEAAGYKVDYGMVHELLNTFSDATREDIKETFYGKPSTAMSDDSLTTMLVSGKATEKGASHKGALATLLYKYSAIDYNDYATNKNRVIMTFGYDNTDYYRGLYYNVRAYLTISPKDTETMTAENTMFVFSNSATLNIAEADKITNGNTTNP